jgi:hypothetical protein
VSMRANVGRNRPEVHNARRTFLEREKLSQSLSSSVAVTRLGYALGVKVLLLFPKERKGGFIK